MADGHMSSVETVAAHIVLTASPTSFLSVPASGTVNCSVEIYNGHTTALVWDDEAQVNLTYRWYTSDGKILVQDGIRTTIDQFILPGERRSFSLSVPVPPDIGNLILRFSCVQEGHFWFCERFPTSGCDVTICTVGPHIWPGELNKSVVARALRGSVAAMELRKLLLASPIICLPEANGRSAGDLVPNEVDET